MRVTTADGVVLEGDVVEAAGPPRATALLLHAMMADRRSFRGDRGLPGVLARHGVRCLVADFRGRGRGSPAFGYDDLVRYDVPAWLAGARAGGLPVVIAGHSLGAHVALAAATRGDRADAYVLLAGNVWLPSLDPHPGRRLARSVAMRAFLAASSRGRFPARRLRFGPVDEPLRYVRDLVGFWRRDAWTGDDGRDYLAGLGTIDLPVLSITGRGDTLMAHAVGARAFAALLPRSEFRAAGRAEGLGADVGHMGLVTDLAARPAWAAVARWLVSTAR